MSPFVARDATNSKGIYEYAILPDQGHGGDDYFCEKKVFCNDIDKDLK